MSELVLTLRQPAQIGDRARSDFVLGTQGYLPGAVVRGAFAAAWIAAHGPPSPGSPSRPQFLRLFEGGVRFGPLFGAAEYVPLSVVSHKYLHTGRCQVIEYDRALHDTVPARCPECESPLEHPKGLRGGTMGVRRRTSVAIAPSGVARRSQIVTRDTLEGGQSFRGTLAAGDPSLLDILAGLGRIRVGGRRTTHGAADVHIRAGMPPPTAQRCDDGRLVLRLRSPGIFTDDQGRPYRDPNPGELQDVLGCPARVVRRWTRWQTVGGWHIASGLPKPAELAVVPGSTYLIETDREVTGEALAALADRGLGLRRHEGFGDLAPAPLLAAGQLVRDAENRRLRALIDSVAPLRSLAVTRPGIWQPLLERLGAHAAGVTTATEFLHRMAQNLEPVDQHAAAALNRYLSMTPSDADQVARELSKS